MHKGWRQGDSQLAAFPSCTQALCEVARSRASLPSLPAEALQLHIWGGGFQRLWWKPFCLIEVGSNHLPSNNSHLSCSSGARLTGSLPNTSTGSPPEHPKGLQTDSSSQERLRKEGTGWMQDQRDCDRGKDTPWVWHGGVGLTRCWI
jgi:hypothetical protein